MRHSRHELAEKELGFALAESPEEPEIFRALAQCLNAQGRPKKGLEAARKGIQLAPDEAFSHFVYSSSLFLLERWPEAEKAARAALELEPIDVDYFQHLASILFNREKWSAALAAAEEGLAIDAEHRGCLNVRARALTKLGRDDEAAATTEGVLARDPEDPEGHATQGWTYLHQNEPNKALEHFGEALRLDPGNTSAREGIVFALKARYWFYRILLQFFLWLNKKQKAFRWLFIFGVFFAQRGLSTLAEKYPETGPFVWPIFIAVALLCLSTWLADPLFNLLLRLNKYGRHAVKPEDRACSLWVGGFLAAGAAVLVWAAVQQSLILVLFSGFFVVDAVLVCAVYRFVTRPRRIASAIVLVCAITVEVAAASYTVESIEAGRRLDESADTFNMELEVKRNAPEGSSELAESTKRLKRYHFQHKAKLEHYRATDKTRGVCLNIILVAFLALTILSQAAPGRKNPGVRG